MQQERGPKLTEFFSLKDKTISSLMFLRNRLGREFYKTTLTVPLIKQNMKQNQVNSIKEHQTQNIKHSLNSSKKETIHGPTDVVGSTF